MLPHPGGLALFRALPERRARFYELTPSGQERLEAKTADWRRSAIAICHMLGLSAPRRLA